MTLSIPIPPDWVMGALCAQIDPEMFFPLPGGSNIAAKRMCQRCEVREECLQYAIEHEQNWGIWGGMSERERRPLKPDYVERLMTYGGNL